MNSPEILQRAKEVLRIESDGILALAERIDSSFAGAVELLRDCTGKVVVTGLGKSGLICRKIAATLASTGTPAIFLHAGDGVHGDLGMVMKGDVVIAVSNSGETEEILKLLPHFKFNAVSLIALTGNPESSLAKAADIVLDVRGKEACPLGLAPTTSTTVALALGDALAVVLLEEKGFDQQDFAVRHPGGVDGDHVWVLELSRELDLAPKALQVDPGRQLWWEDLHHHAPPERLLHVGAEQDPGDGAQREPGHLLGRVHHVVRHPAQRSTRAAVSGRWPPSASLLMAVLCTSTRSSLPPSRRASVRSIR